MAWHGPLGVFLHEPFLSARRKSTHLVGWGGSIHEAAWARLASGQEVLEEYHLAAVGRWEGNRWVEPCSGDQL